MTAARWLTPDAPVPHKYFQRTLNIPASADFLSLVNGALFPLCQAHNWEKSGQMTPEETAAYFLDMWTAYLKNDNEPPAWDTPENVDGQPAQPWYEQLEDWVIQGFLAITFTPLAALVYQTTVPRIRVAIRTGNIGALFKVLINGVEVWTGDSYAPITDLLEQVFDNPNPGSAATVHVIHYGSGPNVSGESKLEYVRGEAVASMVQTILRHDPGGCGIQWSTDNGGSWETIDLVECIQTLAGGQIDQYILDGRLAVPGNQPGGVPGPAPNLCKTFHVVLSGNSQWVLPFGLEYGNTIAVSHLQGAWSDGTLNWYCPDGARFILGQCNQQEEHQESDPLNPGAYHMALIMRAGETWYPAPVAAFTQQSGITPLQVILQANDGALADNTGSISFDVEVCAGTWTHVFEGEALHTDPPFKQWYNGAWDGTKWVLTGGALYLDLHLPAFAGVYLTVLAETPHYNITSTYRLYTQAGSNGTLIAQAGDGTFTCPDGYQGGDYLFIAATSGDIHRITVTGRGTDPFGS